MSLHDDLMAEAAAVLNETFGATSGVDYVAPDGTTTEDIVSIVGAVKTVEVPRGMGVVKELERTVTVNTDPDHPEYAGIAVVSVAGVIVIDGERWAIRDITSQTPTFHVLLCYAVENVEMTSKDYHRAARGGRQ